MRYSSMWDFSEESMPGVREHPTQKHEHLNTLSHPALIPDWNSHIGEKPYETQHMDLFQTDFTGQYKG